MKKLFVLASIALFVAACGKKDPTPEPPPEPDPEIEASLNLGSFNIRLDTSDDTGYKDWQSRKENCATVVKTHEFDVFGLQEVLLNQQKDLKALLPEY